MADLTSFFESTPFTQTEYWRMFQHALGKNTRVLEGTGWHCLFIEQQTKLGTYWIAPHGPIVKDQQCLESALKSIVQEAKKERVAWVVIEPWAHTIDPKTSYKGIRKAYKDYNPADTNFIDLTTTEAQLRRALSPTFRNLINRAADRGLSCKTSNDPQDIQIFLQMLHEVEKSNRVRLHNDHYFQTQASVLMPLGVMHLEIAYHNNIPIAAAMIINTDKTASYVYAASLRETRKLEPGTVLLWQAILEARKRGKIWFDLFGVAPPSSPNHPWAGFSTFKRKFGGTDIALCGTWEIPVDKKRYLAYRTSLPIVRKLQKLRK